MPGARARDAVRRRRVRKRRAAVDGDAHHDVVGLLRHARGHKSISTKQLLYQLGHRGYTAVLEESNTSKMCPCATGAALMDQNEGDRTRAHKSGDRCSLLGQLSEEKRDRDVLATYNMLQDVTAALMAQGRPGFLCAG